MRCLYWKMKSLVIGLKIKKKKRCMIIRKYIEGFTIVVLVLISNFIFASELPIKEAESKENSTSKIPHSKTTCDFQKEGRENCFLKLKEYIKQMPEHKQERAMKKLEKIRKMTSQEIRTFELKGEAFQKMSTQEKREFVRRIQCESNNISISKFNNLTKEEAFKDMNNSSSYANANSEKRVKMENRINTWYSSDKKTQNMIKLDMIKKYKKFCSKV